MNRIDRIRQGARGIARVFAQLMADERPVEVFSSIHTARRWLDENS